MKKRTLFNVNDRKDFIKLAKKQLIEEAEQLKLDRIKEIIKYRTKSWYGVQACDKMIEDFIKNGKLPEKKIHQSIDCIEQLAAGAWEL